jgi:hypothetical protein
MKFKSIAIALAVAAGGLVAGQSFAQDRNVTVTRDTPHGVVTKHIRSENGVVHRVVRVQRPDGSTVVRRSTHVAGSDYRDPRMHRTTVIHRRDEPQRVVVRTFRDRPDYTVRREARIRDSY